MLFIQLKKLIFLYLWDRDNYLERSLLRLQLYFQNPRSIDTWEYIPNHQKETKRLLGINYQQLSLFCIGENLRVCTICQ